MRYSSWKAFAFVAALILAVSPAVVAVPKKLPVQQAATPAMSVCQARRTVMAELQRVDTCAHCYLQSPPSGVAFIVGELVFQAEPKRVFTSGIFKVDLKTLGEVKYDKWRGLLIDGRNPSTNGGGGLAGLARKNLSSASILGILAWQLDANAQDFAKAMNVLRIYARNFDPSRGQAPICFADKDEQARIWAEFQKRAAAWRALPARPPLSEAVRKQQLLAEDAVNQKQFEAAAAAYDAGTEIDPLWPEGHFNAAAIYGELKDYDDAVWHMRCYLELLPNAPDAQAARDQMLLWQAKAEQQLAAPAAQAEPAKANDPLRKPAR